MSTKKRFSISQDLASNIRTTVQAASSNTGQLHYDLMSLDAIEPDPDNPRKLHISKHEVTTGIDPNDANYKIKQHEIEGIAELAESIKKIGVRNAIEVYKDGMKYKIISGERRYLASLYAGQSHIPARISQKPDDHKLSYMQWSENINREDLTLIDKYHNLVKLAETYTHLNKIPITPSVLQEILGTSNSHTYRYFALLKAEPELVELMESGRITNLKVVEEISRMKDVTARKAVLNNIRESDDDVTSINKFRILLHSSTSSKRAVVKPREINLGKTKNLHVARELFHIILQDPRLNKLQFHNIDWSSQQHVTQAFQALLSILEEELA